MVKSKRIFLVNIVMNFLPNSSCQSLKAKLWRWAGVKVGKNVEIFQGVKIQGIGEIEIADGCFIGHEVLFMINEGSKIILEEEAGIGSRSIIITGYHKITPDAKRITSREGTTSIVTLKRGSALATACIVLPGVTVGEMSIVSAGTAVNRDVKPYSLVGTEQPKVYVKEGGLKKFASAI